MSVDDERNLRERLDRAFGAITPHPAPVDDAILRGQGIRVRRRAGLMAGLAAAAAIGALAVPPLVRLLGAAAPVTAAGQYTVTVRPPGPHAQAGLIASGTVNGQRWQVVADRPGSDGAEPGQQGIMASGAAFGPGGEAEQFVPALSAADNTGPVTFTAFYAGATEVQLGTVGAGVTYVTVGLGNGTELALQPVTVYGARAVAFAVPLGAGIIDAAAYSGQVEIAAALPFNDPAGMAMFAAWLRPGQPAQGRVSGPIGSGTLDGRAWSASAYIGPWGTCVVGTGGAMTGSSCLATTLPPRTALMLYTDGTPEVACGIAATSVVRIVVIRPDGTTVQVRPVMIGVQGFFAFALSQGPRPLRWVAYDSFGKVVASSAG